jgi:cellulose synthase/poly-beta-1,6-N-acetylglucosamine synthase-like glycosyltransferase
MRSLPKGTVIVGVVFLLAGIADVGPSNLAADPTPARTTTAVAQTRDPGAPPEKPRATVDIPSLATTGRTVHVPAGGNLQTALDAAAAGDTITLAPDATYRGPFRLRKKTGDGWIVIASASKTLPRPGRRVAPSDVWAMPKLIAASGSVFHAEPGAHHYRFVGLEIAPADGVALNTLVQLGDDARAIDALPHHIIVDRCYIHGDPKEGGRRGIALNSRHTAVVDSYLSDFKDRTSDAQAIVGWNGPGPFRIAGNYLEASGENVMFGGGDPLIPGLVPADIEIVRNHMAKPLGWKKNDPSFEGVEWSVKNLFELKNARRVLVDGNLFEHNWPHAQNGFGILFTVRNQEGGAPWSVVEDVTFSNNLVRHMAAGINVLGRDDNHPSEQTRRITIRNNVFLDIGGQWGHGRLFQLLDGTHAVTIEHNTAFQTGSPLFGGDRVPHTGFVFQANVVPHNEYGITGSGTGPGNPTIERYFPGAAFRSNVIVGARAGAYPPDNFYPASFSEAGVSATGNPSLVDGQPRLRTGSDGLAPGADTEAVNAALGGLATVGPRSTEARSSSPRASGTGLQSAAGKGEAATVPSGNLGTAALFLFWVSLLLMGYVYFGYPLLAALRARLRPRPLVGAPIEIEPFVSIVVVAYNEADLIAARIENLLALDYPSDRFRIVVASDGSTDATVARALRYEHLGVTVHPIVERHGKAAVISAVVPGLCGDIVVFADARQRFDPGTLRALVANFADPTVGAVSGELVLAIPEGTTAAGHGTAFYWRYETFIRVSEGRADSTVGATGAIYAIRRVLFEPIPDDTILDDVLIPLRIVRQGFRAVFEPGARAHDCGSATAHQEFVRKTRTIAGAFQLFARERWLLNPLSNRLWFETMSHKVLRLALPVFHMALLAATLVLASHWIYSWALAGQVAFYAAALVGYSQGQTRRRWCGFSVPCAICLMSWATVIGFVRFLTNCQRVTWERSATPVASLKGA